MPFNTPLPDQGTNPWYTPFKTAWDALVLFVNGLEPRIDEIPPAVDPDWTDVQSKPSTFPPATHTHAQGDVTGLAAELSAIDAEIATKATQTSVNALSDAQTVLAGNLDSTFALATSAQEDATLALSQNIVKGILNSGQTAPSDGVWLRRSA